MIKRALLTLIAIAVLVVPSGPNTRAGAGYRVTDNYYDDQYFSHCVGWNDEYCDGSSDTDGTLTQYRYHEKFGCANTFYTASCQYWNASTSSWTSMTCPSSNQTVAQGRLRIPVGAI